MADQHTFADSEEEYAAAVDAAAERQFVLDDEERSWDMMLVAVIEDVPNEVCFPNPLVPCYQRCRYEYLAD